MTYFLISYIITFYRFLFLAQGLQDYTGKWDDPKNKPYTTKRRFIMKRLTTITMVLTLAAFTLLSLSAFAEDTVPATNTGPSFIDENGDGICDNYQNGGKGLGQGNRANFVDADGDGVCDNYQAGQKIGAHKGHGRGTSRNAASKK